MEDNESGTDDESGKYAGADASPVRCPECGEFVALMWRSLEYFGPHAGFVVRCDCAMGPSLDDKTAGGLWGPWYPDGMDDEMREYYERVHREAIEDG